MLPSQDQGITATILHIAKMVQDGAPSYMLVYKPY